ncbi:MAG: hypothetical protein LAP38_03515 [Acidobacteriia bacterium]|nr:hypothetical protein [Terriglobia bacterium]
MKFACSMIFLGLFASATFAQDAPIVRWKQIVGVITAPGMDNPVAMATDAQGQASAIHAGAGPWSAVSGYARVDLINSSVSFNVTGLVMNGGNNSGLVPANFKVVGTLVCNSGTTDVATAKDTPPVLLSPQGDADFTGQFTTSIPPSCANPLFLIRVPTGRWIATGAVRTQSAQ